MRLQFGDRCGAVVGFERFEQARFAREPCIGDMPQPESRGRVLFEALADGFDRHRLFCRIQPGERIESGWRRGAQDHVVAEATEFVLVTAAFGQELHALKHREMLFERPEEPGIDHQFLVAGDRLGDPLPQLRGGGIGAGLMALDGGMEGSREMQRAHIANEDRATGPQPGRQTLEDAKQVLDVGEILDDRVQDDGVERARTRVVEFLGRAVEQPDLWEWPRTCRKLTGHVVQGDPREVQGGILAAAGREPEQKHARAATDLEHAPGFERLHEADGLVEPFAHLVGRERLPGITAVPPDEIEGRIGAGWRSRRQFAIDHFVIDLPPLADLVLAPRRQLGCFVLAAIRLDQIGHQPPVAAGFVPGDHDRLLHGGVLAKHELDLAQFDAETADLDLVIDPSEELEVPVRQIAHPIPGPVETSVRPVAEGIRDELRGRPFRLVQVTPAYASPAQMQLARDTDRKRLAVPVQHIMTDIGDGTTDGHGGLTRARPARVIRAVDGALGGSVEIVEAGVDAGEELFLQLDRQGLAAAEHAAQGTAGIEAGRLQQHLEQGRDELKRGDPVPADGLHDVHRVRVRFVGIQDQPRSLDQRRPEFPDRRVEAARRALQHAIFRPEREGLGHPEHVVAERAMGNHCASRPPGRTRGIDDIRQRRGRLGQVKVGVRRGGPCGGVAVHAQDWGGGARDQRATGFVGENHAGPRIPDHVIESVLGITGIQRKVSAAGLQRAQQADHQIGSALETYPHQIVGADTEFPEMMCQPVGPPIQLVVGDPLIVGLDRHRPRCPVNLRLDHPVDQGVRRIVARCPVPLVQDQRTFDGVEQREFRQCPRRIGRDLLEQRRVVARHAGDSGGLEEVGVVFPPTREAVRRFEQAEGDIEDGRAALDLERSDAARIGGGSGGRVEQLERDREQRVAAEVTFRLELLDQRFEREILVGIGTQRHLLHPVKQLDETGVARTIGADHERVHKEPDQPLDLGTVPTGDGGSDDDVVLVGVSVQQRLKRGEQRHEQCHSFTPAQLVKHSRQPPRQCDLVIGPLVGLYRRTGSVGRKLQHRQTRQLLPPVGELRVPNRTPQPAPLPDREVGVLNRQLRQGRRPSQGEGTVDFRQLPRQHPERPTIAHNVVQRKQEHIIHLAQPQQPRPQQRAGAQIKRGTGRLGRQPNRLGLAFGFREMPQIGYRQRYSQRRRDDLDRFTVPGAEGGAE